MEGLRERGLHIEVLGVNAISWFRIIYAIIRRPQFALRLIKKLLLMSCTLRCTLSTAGRAISIEAKVSQADHIHAHFLGLPTLVAHCLSCLTGIPYSLTAHAHDIYAETTPPSTIKEASFRTTCTATNKDYLTNKYPDAPFTLVRHGLDASQYIHEHSIRTAPPCRILAVGRLVEKKGFADLILACKHLKENDFPLECTIVGEGPLKERLIALRNSSGLKELITILEFMEHDKLIKHYQHADLLVAPSIEAENGDRDGVPNVILEAMASNLPIVTTPAGSIQEVILDKKTGVLVPQSNPLALAEAIRTAWKNPKLRKTMTINARNYIIDEMSPEKWLKVLMNFFS